MLKNCIIGKFISYFCKKCKCSKCDFYKKCECPKKNKDRRQKEKQQINHTLFRGNVQKENGRAVHEGSPVRKENI